MPQRHPRIALPAAPASARRGSSCNSPRHFNANCNSPRHGSSRCDPPRRRSSSWNSRLNIATSAATPAALRFRAPRHLNARCNPHLGTAAPVATCLGVLQLRLRPLLQLSIQHCSFGYDPRLGTATPAAPHFICCSFDCNPPRHGNSCCNPPRHGNANCNPASAQLRHSFPAAAGSQAGRRAAGRANGQTAGRANGQLPRLAAEHPDEIPH